MKYEYTEINYVWQSYDDYSGHSLLTSRRKSFYSFVNEMADRGWELVNYQEFENYRQCVDDYKFINRGQRYYREITRLCLFRKKRRLVKEFFSKVLDKMAGI